MVAPLSLTAETFLLFTHARGGQEQTAHRRYALAAAATIELQLHQRIELTEDYDPRLHVVDAAPLGDPALDRLLGLLAAEDGARLSDVISERRTDLTETVGTMLSDAGVLRRRRVLFLVEWPVRDPAPEAALRERLAAALRDGHDASLRDVNLLTLLRAMSVGYVIIRRDVPDLGREEVLRRIDDLWDESPAVDVLEGLRRQVASATSLFATMH